MVENEENMTRVYNVNLGKAWNTPRYKRTDRVLNIIREFAKRHMKAEKVKIEQDLNRSLWYRGKTNPPRTVRVRMVREDDVVTVSSFGESKNKEELKVKSNESQVVPENTDS